mmetsp:Transcript_69327/g.209838  ORF Transcript_69327/g.209838 Transcript_69327/m.209838 type:complete len:538 (+) Transcript_69327:3-1616(+)
MRTVALAFRDFDAPPDWDGELARAESQRLTGLTAKTFAVETGLTFLGLVGIQDPIRPDVPPAIEQCRRAGVAIVMVTGDHLATAVAIAKQCGILRPGIDFDAQSGALAHKYTAMTGGVFREKVLLDKELDQKSFDEVWPHLRVLARSSPEDKHRLVSGLIDSELFRTEEGRRLGVHPSRQVVAAIGDGTNDAPALRRADVGFAMNVAGTNVARQAADILLLDDSFGSVVKACKWGRNVYDSVAKFLQVQLTSNLTAALVCLFSIVAVNQVPLGVTQILWVSIIFNSLGALSLASELPDKRVLDRAPHGRNQRLVSPEMWCKIVGQSLFQTAVLAIFVLHAAGPACPQEVKDCGTWPVTGGFLDMKSSIRDNIAMETVIGRDETVPATEHHGLIFCAFAFMQLFNWINCRSLSLELNVFAGIHRNPTLCIALAACIFLQFVVVQAPALGSGVNIAFKTKALRATHFLLCIACGASVLVWQPVVSLLGRPICRCLRHLEYRYTERRRQQDTQEPSTIGAPSQGTAAEAAEAGEAGECSV